jgi:hypothetical protein
VAPRHTAAPTYHKYKRGRKGAGRRRVQEFLAGFGEGLAVAGIGEGLAGEREGLAVSEGLAEGLAVPEGLAG